jgi:hypothetical protein
MAILSSSKNPIWKTLKAIVVQVGGKSFVLKKGIDIEPPLVNHDCSHGLNMDIVSILTFMWQICVISM